MVSSNVINNNNQKNHYTQNEQQQVNSVRSLKQQLSTLMSSVTERAQLSKTQRANCQEILSQSLVLAKSLASSNNHELVRTAAKAYVVAGRSLLQLFYGIDRTIDACSLLIKAAKLDPRLKHSVYHEIGNAHLYTAKKSEDIKNSRSAFSAFRTALGLHREFSYTQKNLKRLNDWQRPERLSQEKAIECFESMAWLVTNRRVSNNKDLGDTRSTWAKCLQEKADSLKTGSNDNTVTTTTTSSTSPQEQTQRGKKRSRQQNSTTQILSSSSSSTSTTTIINNNNEQLQHTQQRQRTISHQAQAELNQSLQSQSATNLGVQLMACVADLHKQAMGILQQIPDKPELLELRSIATNVIPVLTIGGHLQAAEARTTLLRAAQAQWLPEYGQPNYPRAIYFYRFALKKGAHVAHLHLAEIAARQNDLAKAQTHLLSYLGHLAGKTQFSTANLLRLGEVPVQSNEQRRCAIQALKKLQRIYKINKQTIPLQICCELAFDLGDKESLDLLESNCRELRQAHDQAAMFTNSPGTHHQANPAIASYKDLMNYWNKRGVTELFKRIRGYLHSAIACQAMRSLRCAETKSCQNSENCLAQAKKLAEKAIERNLSAYVLARSLLLSGKAKADSQQIARLSQRAISGGFRDPRERLPSSSQSSTSTDKGLSDDIIKF